MGIIKKTPCIFFSLKCHRGAAADLYKCREHISDHQPRGFKWFILLTLLHQRIKPHQLLQVWKVSSHLPLVLKWRHDPWLEHFWVWLKNTCPEGIFTHACAPSNFVCNWLTLQAAKFKFAKLESLTLWWF